MFDMIESALATRTVTEPSSPLVVSVPHADLFVDRLYRIGEADAPEVYVAAQTSRFVCDMNRDPDDVSQGAVPEHPAPRNTDGRGFIWAITTAGAPALARPLALDEWRERTAIHAAYHHAIVRALTRARERFGYAILLDGHSMPSRGRLGHKDPGRARASATRFCWTDIRCRRAAGSATRILGARALRLRDSAGRTFDAVARPARPQGSWARARFGYAILLDGHSMPSRGRLGHKDPGRARA